MELKSDLEKGATFTVCLPMHKAAVIQAKTAKEACHRGRLVLVCDDEPLLLGSILNALRYIGYEARGVTDSTEAFNIAKELKSEIGLLLVDIVMPNMTGPELVASLHINDPELPVLYMSGNTVGNSTKQGIVPEQRLQKPFQINELKNRIANCIN